MTNSQDILKMILYRADELSARGEPLLAVFDLDSTLFNVSPRSQKILDHFLEKNEVKQRFPREAGALKGTSVGVSDWGLSEPLERAGITKGHPLHKELIDHWVDHFFSSHFLEADEPFVGAVEFVTELHSLGALITYLTGRNREHMEQGTLESLENKGFPLPQDSVELLMKPNKHVRDADFKKDAFVPLIKTHRDIFFFENEPVIINQVAQHCPEVKIIFVDSVHSGRESAPLHLPVIPMRFDF